MLRTVVVVLFIINAVENNTIKGLIPTGKSGSTAGAGNQDQQTAEARSSASTNNGKGGSAASESYSRADITGGKATAETYSEAASTSKGEGNTDQAKAFGKSQSFGDENNSAATSKSMATAFTKGKDGGQAASSTWGSAEAMNLGGKNGLGIATAATMSSAVAKNGTSDEMSVSNSAVTSTDLRIGGKTIKTPRIKTPPMDQKIKNPLSKFRKN